MFVTKEEGKNEDLGLIVNVYQSHTCRKILGFYAMIY